MHGTHRTLHYTYINDSHLTNYTSAAHGVLKHNHWNAIYIDDRFNIPHSKGKQIVGEDEEVAFY